MTAFLTGVIEGFYGRAWPHDMRLAYAQFLAAAGLNTYIYAPKGDPFLRRRWREDWPPQEWQQLRELAARYRACGVNWGVGLSPVALYQSYGRGERDALQAKLATFSELDASVLCILFDDMPGNMDELAPRQADLLADVVRWAPQQRIIMCPTYYSFDPVLPQFFGAMPEGYWQALGAALPERVDIFWTGNTVCSSAICRADLEAITELLGRPVVLWDNYPVNDGAQRSQHLYLEALPGRAANIRGLLHGHLCNPMNQPLLSLPGLAGLATLYGLDGFAEDDLQHHLGAATWRALQRDAALFQERGLAAMDNAQRESLALAYARLEEPGAAEVARWLRGEYAFDPACLTD